ncbi:hypothetical protein D3C72_1441390 [compost metagenome]
MRTLARNSAPVFMRCIASSASRVMARPTFCRSIAWPPAMPVEPDACASSATSFSLAAGVTISAPASTMKAWVCSASPTSSAVASS